MVYTAPVIEICETLVFSAWLESLRDAQARLQALEPQLEAQLGVVSQELQGQLAALSQELLELRAQSSVTGAASRGRNSSGDITRCVLPSRQGVS